MHGLLYWWKVVKISFFSTGELLGWGHPGRWWFSALFTLLAAAFYFFWFRDANVPADKLMWLVFLLAGAGTVFLAVFAFTMLATPPRLAAQATAEFHKTITGVSGEWSAKVLELRSNAETAKEELVMRVAALASKLDPALAIMAREERGDKNEELKVRLIVQNQSALSADSVAIRIHGIEILHSEDAAIATKIIDILVGQRLRPRRAREAITIAGRDLAEFYFANITSGGVWVTTETSHVLTVADGLGTEIIQHQTKALPRGRYRFELIVAAGSRASKKILCSVQSDQVLGFELAKS